MRFLLTLISMTVAAVMTCNVIAATGDSDPAIKSAGMIKVRRDSGVDKRLLASIHSGDVPLLHSSKPVSLSSPLSNDRDDGAETAPATSEWKRSLAAITQPFLPMFGTIGNDDHGIPPASSKPSSNPSDDHSNDEDVEGQWMMRGWRRRDGQGSVIQEWEHHETPAGTSLAREDYHVE